MARLALSRAAALALLAAACADPAPRSPVAPPPITIAPAAPAPSAAPSAAPTAQAEAPQKKRPPPVACPPRPGYAPPSFTHARRELRGPHGSADMAGPRFATTDPDLAGSLANVQSAVDGWLDEKTSRVTTCKKGCGITAYCEITRNDGELLSLLCTNEFWFQEWRSGSSRDSFLFRREGKRFEPVTVQSLARDPTKSFLFRILPTWDADSDKPLSEEADLPPFYVAFHADSYQIGTALPFDPSPRGFRPFAESAHHLTCDALLDFPSGPPPSPSSETGALAMATHVAEADDPLVAAYWVGVSGSSMNVTRFAAIEARHAAAAKMLNEAVEGWIARVRDRAKAEGWGPANATCRAYTSTNRLVSVLCYGGGENEDGDTRTARGSITIRLGDPPERVPASEIFAKKPGAPREIAKRCLGHLVRKPKDKRDGTLEALPRLTAKDLEDFAFWQSGAMFAVEYELAGKRKLMPCYVPNEVLGTSGEMVAVGKKK